MSAPTDPKDPDHHRPKNKATMEEPQEEFIESHGAHVDDEKANEEQAEHTKGSGAADKQPTQ
jgi:hypothetical protein